MKLFLYTPVIVFGIFSLLFAVEKVFPLRGSRAGLLARLIVNGMISGLTFLIAMMVVRPSADAAREWASRESFGLVHVLQLPGWAGFVVGFLLLDLSFYYWHVLNHQVPFLWRFHTFTTSTRTWTSPPASASILAKYFCRPCFASCR
jgi:sterol desaturase/sphingolipid hydroxylase (fatty acid hydroxylase superfamily)